MRYFPLKRYISFALAVAAAVIVALYCSISVLLAKPESVIDYTESPLSNKAFYVERIEIKSQLLGCAAANKSARLPVIVSYFINDSIGIGILSKTISAKTASILAVPIVIGQKTSKLDATVEGGLVTVPFPKEDVRLLLSESLIIGDQKIDPAEFKGALEMARTCAKTSK